MLSKGLGPNENLPYEKIFVEILDHQVKWLSNKEFFTVKVLWRNQRIEGVTWEAKTDMRYHYLHLFSS